MGRSAEHDNDLDQLPFDLRNEMRIDTQKKVKAQEIFAYGSPDSGRNSSRVSYPSYQKEILAINDPLIASPPPIKPREQASLLRQEAPAFVPQDQQVKHSGPKQYLDVSGQSQEQKVMKESQEYEQSEDQFFDSAWVSQNLSEGRVSLKDLNMIRSQDSLFFQIVDNPKFIKEQKLISTLISKVATHFKPPEVQIMAIQRICKTLNLSFKRMNFFKQNPVKVVPFGSAGNGSWISGSASINLAVLFTDQKLIEQVPLEQQIQKINIAIKQSLKELEPHRVPWPVAPVIRFMLKEKINDFKFDVFLSPNALCPVLTSQLLTAYSKLEPRFAQLQIFLHEWLRIKAPKKQVQDLCPPYVLQLLLLSFMQTRNPPLLPNLQLLRRATQIQEIGVRVLLYEGYKNYQETVKKIDPYINVPEEGEQAEDLVGEYYEHAVRKNQASLGRLFCEFLYFYLHKFKKQEWVVDPALGGFSFKFAQNSNALSVKDPFYSPTEHVLRAGSTNWEALMGAFEETLNRFKEGVPILDMQEMNAMKQDKDRIWKP